MVGSLIIFTREQKPSVELQTLLEQNKLAGYMPLICTQGNPVPQILNEKLKKLIGSFSLKSIQSNYFFPI